MAASAILGILAALAFITVGWPGTSRRVVIGIIIFSAMGFLISVAFAVLAAARDTYIGTSDHETRAPPSH